MGIRHKRAFISYSRDSSGHDARVRALADRLCNDGIDCDLDQYVEDDPPREGWPRWMSARIANADFVLIVCTEQYAAKARGEVPRDLGCGVKWESFLLIDDLYHNGSLNSRFVPVVFGSDHIDVIRELRSTTRYDVSTEAGYVLLLRRLTGQRRATKPQVAREVRRLDAVAEASCPAEPPFSQLGGNTGVATGLDTQDIIIRINRRFSDYTPEQRQQFLEGVAKFLQVDNVRLIRQSEGSVLLQLRLTSQQAEKLLWAINRGDFREFDATEAKLVQPHGEAANSTGPESNATLQREKDQAGDRVIDEPASQPDPTGQTARQHRESVTEGNLDQLCSLFQLLSDRTRLSILMRLAEGECNITSLCEELSLPQPTVSHHLGLLRMNNLVGNRRHGKQVYYGLHRPGGEQANNVMEFSVQNLEIQVRAARAAKSV